MLVVCYLALAKIKEVKSVFSYGLLNDKDAQQMDSILDSGLDAMLAQTLADNSLILTIDGSH
jgi:hypothetical protein